MPLQLMQGITAIVERLGIVWLQRERAVIARKRLIDPASILQGITAIVQRLGIVRPYGERPVIACQRLIIPLNPAGYCPDW